MGIVAVGVFVVLVSLILNWIRIRRKRFSIFKNTGIPGPEPNFWTGNYKEITEKREDCVKEYVKKYGDVVGFFIGAKPFVIATDEELIKIIQVTEFEKFGERDMILRDGGIPQPETLLSMVASSGEDWRKKRGLVAPSFHIIRLKKLMPMLNDAVETFVKVLEKSSLSDYVNILEPVRNVSLDIMIRVALGIESRVQHLKRNKVVDSARLFLLPDTTDILPAISLLFPEFEPVPTMLRNIKDTMKYYLGLPSAKFVYKSVRRVMNRRRKSSERHNDILQGLMEEHVELRRQQSEDDSSNFWKGGQRTYDSPQPGLTEHIALSDGSIVGTCAILLVAGFDTNSITIAHAVNYLAKHQDVQEKLRDEINLHIGTKDDITYEDVYKLSFLDQILAETLRLHPTGMLTVNRVVAEPLVYKGMTIPKGVTVIIPSNYLHRNPKHWRDPEKFDPERFAPENISNITPYIYQPYGNGRRNCVGRRFAQLVMKLILTRLVRSYNIKKYSDKEIDLNYAIFIPQPKEVLVKVEPIK